MPDENLPAQFQEDLRLCDRWTANGRHYQKTAEHWLQNMDTAKSELMPLLAQTYGADQAVKWWAYWRVFFLSCAELWGFHNGEEWQVSHYLMQKPVERTSS